MTSWISLIISCLALAVSGLTAWLTFFRKGSLMMTQPTTIFFGPDSVSHSKIYFRTLLFCTAKKGVVLESLHVTLTRNDSKQTFSVWVYGEKGRLYRGSGLFIPQEGIACDHHFLMQEDGSSFDFLSGKYSLAVNAKLVGQNSPAKLISIPLEINELQVRQLNKPETGIYFDWIPQEQNYHSHVRRKTNDSEELVDLFADNSFLSKVGSQGKS